MSDQEFAPKVGLDAVGLTNVGAVMWNPTPAELYEEAVLNDEVRLSPPVSIAFRLLADWFRNNGGGNLEDIVRRARAMNVSLSSC